MHPSPEKRSHDGNGTRKRRVSRRLPSKSKARLTSEKGAKRPRERRTAFAGEVSSLNAASEQTVLPLMMRAVKGGGERLASH